MDNDNEQRTKSLKTMADNERWLNEHPKQTVHAGDFPVSEEKPSPNPEASDQQQ